MMIETYQAQSLEGAEINKPSMVVDNLLPAGLTVLAGAPKLGKSWLALQLCCCVANQELFLGRQTIQGGVLYLDLEGSKARLQDRLSQLDYGFPEYLSVAHKAPRTDGGELVKALMEWYERCNAYPRLIVIDTVARIKGTGQRGKNAYEADSDIFGALQSFALENQLAIVCITHLKKNDRFSGSEDDWLERISGSMGLSGVADNIWALFRKRGENTAYLRTSARDIDAGDMVLKFNNGLWEFVSNNVNDHEFKTKPIVKFFESISHFSGSASELYEKYISFCEDQKIPHGLSETQPITSFGKQVKAVQHELWRIRKSVTDIRKSKGKYYFIDAF